MTDFYVTPVVGVRTWRMNADALTLNALVSPVTWLPRRPMVSTHVDFFGYAGGCEPGQPCGQCGIWAFNNYASVEKHRAVGWNVSAREVRGLVAGWGTVHLATKGWRAGKAYPLALFEWVSPPEQVFDGPFWHRVMHQIAERYGIPVITAGEIAELLDATGVVLPSEVGGA